MWLQDHIMPAGADVTNFALKTWIIEAAQIARAF